MRISRWLLSSGCPRGVVLIRFAVGTVFVSEGIQKFLYPAALGVGRFAKIGIPTPELMGPFVAVIEILCGSLVLAGLLTRIAALLLIADVAVAILSTKIPILLGYGYWHFAGPSPTKPGLWSMLHEARTDLSMLLASGFLLLVGGGRVSLDACLLRDGREGRRPDERA